MVHGLSDENLHPEEEVVTEASKSRFTDLFDDEPSLRERTAKLLSKILKSPRVWYLSGVIDTLLVIWAYRHFIA